MAEKGCCLDCYRKYKKVVFFDVNKNNNCVYCPNCGKKFENEEAIDNYIQFFNELYEEAEIDLFKACDYEKACSDYSNIIMLDGTEIVARYGRLLSLLYVSSLRKTKFDEIIFIYKEEKTKFLRSPKYMDYYFTFLKFFDLGLDDYFERMLKSLSIRGYFYDLDSIRLYYERINELIKLKKIVVDETSFLYEKEELENISELTRKANEDIERFKIRMTEKVSDIEGVLYNFEKIDKDGEAVVEFFERHKDVHIVSKKKSLKPQKGYSLIPDNIFTLTKFSYLTSKFSLPLFIVSLIASGVFFALFILLDQLKILWIILAIVFILSGFASITLHMLWSYNSKNRNYLLMKPFRRK